MYENIDEEEFAEKLAADDNAVLLDVRTQQEWDSGYIKGAILLDFFNPEFPKEVEKLDKAKNYYIYCRSGNRSGQACGLMEGMGFAGELYNLEGGVMAWTGDLEE
ncbi:rhodanese [Reichenbachiella sp. 5M10]|uniref:rhodanese-like domain-containing protein n=1 Tax=Reichenbachiella sp. 5M10 TaxID=1889772 RepID=UPI000C1500D5|nr:rhodanese-like domain-containing protein [Reichenbachiella sp. 5M10]PIB34208.1 rhodanese [Reichenbachiella sp. 5M10]